MRLDDLTFSILNQIASSLIGICIVAFVFLMMSGYVVSLIVDKLGRIAVALEGIQEKLK